MNRIETSLPDESQPRQWLDKLRALRTTILSEPRNYDAYVTESSAKARVWRELKKAKLVVIAFILFSAIGTFGYWEEQNLRQQAMNTIAQSMIPIDGGGFLMGSTAIPDLPLHPVIVQPFAISKFEVTQDQFDVILGYNPSHFSGVGNRPVDSASWTDAQSFVDTLNSLQNGYRFRIPNETEWEYACRAGSITKYFWGPEEQDLPKYAWFSKNSSGVTHPVGVLQSNSWGLHDTSGNVWEWCQDENTNSPKTEASKSNMYQKVGSHQVLRGGSWFSDSEPSKKDSSCSSSYRFNDSSKQKNDQIGFRLAGTRIPAKGMTAERQISPLTAQCQIASEYSKRGQLLEAEKIFRELLPKGYEVQLQDSSVRTAVLGLADVCFKTQKNAEGESLLNQILIQSKHFSTPDNKLTTLSEVAEIYKSQGNVAKTESLWKQIGNTNGVRPTDLIKTELNLADMYLKQNRIDEADVVSQKAMEQLKATNNSALTTEVQQKLNAIVLLRAWNINTISGTAAFKEAAYESAESHFKQALIDARGLGDTDKIATTLNNLAAVFHAQRKYSAAEVNYQEAQAILTAQGKRSSEALGRLLKNYAALLRNTHRETQASQLEAQSRSLVKAK